MTDYFYDMDLVVDPLNTANVVANGVVSIYDPSDTAGTTLLALKDPSGNPLPNPLKSNAYGFIPPRIAGLPQTMWKSGNFTGYFNSYKGLRDEAVAARTAAEGAADNAAEAASEALAGAVSDAEAAATAAASAAALVGAPADSAIAAAVNGNGATKAALTATYATAESTPSWKPNTAYSAGAKVVSPAGALVKASTGFTSGSTYNATNWTVVAPAALMPRYYDDGGNYTDRAALQVLARQVPAPTTLQHNFFSIVSGLGDNATFIGVSGGMFQARDLPAVSSTTKGVLYGAQFVVAPAIDRNNVPFDDVVGISIENQGTGKGTDALYFGHTRGDRATNPTGQDWGNIIQNDAAAPNFIRTIGAHDIGLSLSGATITTAAIRLGNAHSIAAMKADGTLKHLFRLSAGNTLQLAQGTGGLDIRDAFGGIYAQSKIVLPNNTALAGVRNGATTEYEMVRITTGDNLALFAARATVLAGGGLMLQDVTTVPAAPVGGAVLYSEAGVLKSKGPSGAITTIGAA